MKLRNEYYIFRHGQAISNTKSIISCWPEKFKNPLTKTGVAQVKAAVKELTGKDITIIFASDILRTRQTADIVAGALKLKVKLDKRLREYDVGEFNGRSIIEFSELFPNRKLRFTKTSKKGETYTDIKNRMVAFIKEVDKKYTGKTILIVSHQLPLVMLSAWYKGLSQQETIEKFFHLGNRMRPAEVRKLM